jgi:L-fucose mutarotase/ribose pyranase (RbsD/FucU family)
MLANLIYLGYTIGILITDFNFPVDASTSTTSTNDTENITETTTAVLPILDQAAGDEPIVNSLYFGKIDSNVPCEC